MEKKKERERETRCSTRPPIETNHISQKYPKQRNKHIQESFKILENSVHGQNPAQIVMRKRREVMGVSYLSFYLVQDFVHHQYQYKHKDENSNHIHIPYTNIILNNSSTQFHYGRVTYPKRALSFQLQKKQATLRLKVLSTF